QDWQPGGTGQDWPPAGTGPGQDWPPTGAGQEWPPAQSQEWPPAPPSQDWTSPPAQERSPSASQEWPPTPAPDWPPTERMPAVRPGRLPDERPAQTPAPTGEEFLPIFAAVESSSWFTKASPTTQDRREPWESPADTGWQAAQAVNEPVSGGGTTSSGLPKRTPRANLVPGSAAPPPQPPPEPISPDRLRSRLSSYQQGVQKGRAELEEDA
ncbi:MAG: hypothetical protein HOY71_20390, partial [Nonomuraea sp.]|nr:hypothetical protein [Nonomuraea sp.]